MTVAAAALPARRALDYGLVTARVVVESTDRAFISGCRMSAAQLQRVIESGSLGGG